VLVLFVGERFKKKTKTKAKSQTLGLGVLFWQANLCFQEVSIQE
jgi:hypothetical protein